MNERVNLKSSALWQSRILGRSGYATVAREILKELSSRPIEVAFRSFFPEMEDDPETRQAGWYQKALQTTAAPGSSYIAFYVPAGQSGSGYYREARDMNPGHSRYIGYTMFETDRIPRNWVKAIEAMDEIWVPTKFNRDTFSRSGVPREKIHVMPLGIDPDRFDPARRRPFPFSTEKKFRFLSTFEWTHRKGWDVLLRAYAEEFRAEDPVTLVLCTYRGCGVNQFQRDMDLRKEIDRFLLENLGLTPDRAPELLLIEERIPEDRWADLFFSANAFVLPTRGEGWGVPYTEAALASLPIIATNWGAQTEFLNHDNSYLIDIAKLGEVSFDQVLDNGLYCGHRWAEPSVASLRLQMRRVFECPSEASQKGRCARETILGEFTIKHTADRILSRLQEPASTLPESKKPRVLPNASVSHGPNGPLRMLWVGDDPEEEGLRLLLSCYCAVLESPGLAELTVASASEESKAKVERAVQNFLPLCRSRLRYVPASDLKQRQSLLSDADLFIFPSGKIGESPRVLEAIEQGTCLLASDESIRPSLRREGLGVFISTMKYRKGRGEQRSLIGRVYPNVLGSLLRWAIPRREELRAMGRAMFEVQGQAVTEAEEPIAVIASASPSFVAQEPFQVRLVEVSEERGGWSGAMLGAIEAGRRQLVGIAEGDLWPGRHSIEAMLADTSAALLYETSKDGACVLFRPYKALAYAELNSKFYGFDALREWSRAIRFAGGVVLGSSDHRFATPFCNANDDGAIAFLESSDAYVATGQLREAIRSAQCALARKPDYSAARIRLAELLMKVGNESEWVEAERHFLAALELSPMDPALRHAYARLLALMSRHQEAVLHFSFAAQMGPYDVEFWRSLGAAQRQLGQIKESAESFERVDRLVEQEADAHEVEELSCGGHS